MLNEQQMVCDRSLRWWADNSRELEIRWIAQELIERRALAQRTSNQQAGTLTDELEKEKQ